MESSNNKSEADSREKKSDTSGQDFESIKTNQKGFIEVQGIVEDLLPATTFKVKLDNGCEILAHLSGKMRMFRIKILPGDRVKIEMTPYDLTKGRITYRM